MLTACGIETWRNIPLRTYVVKEALLQQCLPLAVLKHCYSMQIWRRSSKLQQCLPLAVLKLEIFLSEAIFTISCNSAYRLRYWNFMKIANSDTIPSLLQQCLPLAVLKLIYFLLSLEVHHIVAIVPTACGIETLLTKNIWHLKGGLGCNSAYRLRYWNTHKLLRQLCKAIEVAPAPTACGMYHLNSIKPRENHLDLLGVFVS